LALSYLNLQVRREGEEEKKRSRRVEEEGENTGRTSYFKTRCSVCCSGVL
jgi:hypothetical protein